MLPVIHKHKDHNEKGQRKDSKSLDTKYHKTKATKHNPANSPINSKLTKLVREKVFRNERSRELQKKENPCKDRKQTKKG